MNIIMLGAPGAGKGTIASQISEKYSLPQISTGQIFRENIKNSTQLGILAKSFIDKGALVPDDITTKMVADTIKNYINGYILDGFPRTVVQADSLNTILKNNNSKIDMVLLVLANDKDIVMRLMGRRVCEKCGTAYHIENIPPKISDVCDKCGGRLIQRKDDTAEVINDRLKTYYEMTKPLIDYYDKQGILKRTQGFVDSQQKRLDEIDKMIKSL